MAEMLSPDSILSKLTPYADRPLLVAFSGGVDSTVLLHLLAVLRDQGYLKSLSAVHIHHGLSDYADDWAEHCRKVCEQLSVPLTVRQVVIEGSADIELQARNQRYRVFEELLPEGGCLLMGHHQDDQAETLLFRLFRGSGIDGLAGIPASRALGRGTLLRPLLSVSRQQIEAYAQANSLDYVEDDSNTDHKYRRNYLRHSLIPEIERQWPNASRRLALLADELGEVGELMGNVTEVEYRNVAIRSPGVVWGGRDLLDIEQLGRLSPASAKRVLRYWLGRYGCSMPDRSHLDVILSEIAGAREDAEPCFRLSGFDIRRSDNFLVLVLNRVQAFQAEESAWNPAIEPCLKLSDGSRLLLENNLLEGGPLEENNLPEVVVKYRQHLPEGLKVRVKGRKGSKTVKRWLQEYRIPAWMRHRIPFLFVDDRMIAAAGIWSCEGLTPEEQVVSVVKWLDI